MKIVMLLVFNKNIYILYVNCYKLVMHILLQLDLSQMHWQPLKLPLLSFDSRGTRLKQLQGSYSLSVSWHHEKPPLVPVGKT